MSTTEDHKESQVYELGYLLLPSIAEENLSTVVDSLKGIVKKVGATELDSEEPLKFDLAYTMSKVVGARKYVVDEAYIGWLKFECEPGTIAEIDSAVKKMEEVLRYLIVKTTKETAFTFAAAMKAKEDKQREQEEEREAPAEVVEKVIE